jgi:hypothetical protein
MSTLKNNDLTKVPLEQLCELHNVKRVLPRKVRLCTLRSRKFFKKDHILNRKGINPCSSIFADLNSGGTSLCQKQERCTGAKKSSAGKLSGTLGTTIRNSGSSGRVTYCDSNENGVIIWLKSVGMKIRRLSSQKYFFNNKIYSVSELLLFANRKRSEKNLSPFYIRGLTEE